MRRIGFIVLLTSIIFNEAASQTPDGLKLQQRTLVQAGGFLYMQNGYVVHASMERTFRRKHYVTYGARFEYARGNTQHDNSIYAGVQLKFFPTYWADPAPYRGLYIGIAPLAIVGIESHQVARYGIGLASLVGYQYVFNKRNLSLGIEASLVPCYNFSDNSPSDAYTKGNYLNSFLCLKVGFKI